MRAAPASQSDRGKHEPSWRFSVISGKGAPVDTGLVRLLLMMIMYVWLDAMRLVMHSDSDVPSSFLDVDWDRRSRQVGICRGELRVGPGVGRRDGHTTELSVPL